MFRSAIDFYSLLNVLNKDFWVLVEPICNFCYYPGHNDKCIAQLISKTKDMSAVAGSIFSHLAVQNKNILVTMLIVRIGSAFLMLILIPFYL